MEHIVVADRGSVRIVTLNRPERMNALSRALVAEIGAAAREAAATATTRALVLTGAGKAFCAGADLKERTSMTEAEVKAFLGVYRDAFGAVDRCPKPVIAAIGGAAFGGGLELALACDLRVADPMATMGLVEVRVGIIPGAGGTQRLPRLIGPGRAKDLIVTGRRVDAKEALSLGLVNRVSEPGEVLDEAVAWGAEIAESCAPVGVAQALAAIDGGLDLSLEEGLAHEQRCYEVTLPTADRLEGIAAFAAKRKPSFKGE
ncbi:MAG: enoyl-CoA hydratase/isomerase family protein [Deltaproteobacteria bacterium]|nr:enoyl-CoA hydratase/isomerase family protein [Deltaproteobacteria bacterium]